MGRHTSMGTIEREVVAETEDERTALAHLRVQRHNGPACPICRGLRSIATMHEQDVALAFDRGYDAAISMVAGG